jgi:hypothetical protein
LMDETDPDSSFQSGVTLMDIAVSFLLFQCSFASIQVLTHILSQVQSVPFQGWLPYITSPKPTV